METYRLYEEEKETPNLQCLRIAPCPFKRWPLPFPSHPLTTVGGQDNKIFTLEMNPRTGDNKGIFTGDLDSEVEEGSALEETEETLKAKLYSATEKTRTIIFNFVFFCVKIVSDT